MKRPQQQRTGTLLIVLLTGLFMANADGSIVNVAAPVIHRQLNATGAELQLIVSGYTVSYAMLLVSGARVGQMRGYGRMFLMGVVVFTLASLACGYAPNAEVLIAARVVQGVGSALMVAQVLTGIQVNFSGQERIRAIGWYAMALSAGAVAGQVLGGAVVSANLLGASWRPAFWINVPVGVSLAIAALRYLPMQRERREESLDVGGLVWLSSAVLLVVVPLILGRDQHWPMWTWLSLALSLPALGLFAIQERQVRAGGGKPLLNLQLVTRGAVGWGLVAAGASACTYFGMLFVLAFYLQQGLGKTPLYSGLALVSMAAAFGLSGPLVGRVPRERVALVAVVGYAILVASYAGISASLAGDKPSSGWVLMMLLGVAGLGLGLGRNSTVADMTSSVPDHYAADMSGLINTDTQISGAAGVALFGALYLGLAPRLGASQAVPAFLAVNAAFALAALLSTLTAWLALRFRRRESAEVSGAAEEESRRAA